MRIRTMAAAAAIAVGGSVAVATPASAADIGDFQGVWYAEDHVDGSNTYLWVNR